MDPRSSRASVRGDVLASALAAAVRGLRTVWWYLTSLMGENAYATYVEHHRREHPGQEPISEKAFWRKHYADQDANPGARCC